MRLQIQPATDESATSAPSRKMRAQFIREVHGAGLPAPPKGQGIVSEGEVAPLPDVVRRYLRFMGVVGRPRTWSFRMRSVGHFRLSPTQKWMPCEAWQYDAALGVARIFHMRLRYAGFLPMLVRDTYLRGSGRMSGRIFDTFRVVDESNPKLHIGELVTWLNDAILFAPAMLLGPMTSFRAVDDAAFDVTLHDRGQSVSARVFVDESGRVTDFSTTDRFGNDPASPKEMVQARWSTPVFGWTKIDGRAVPSGGTAIWHFPSGDFAYADFRFVEIDFDVAP